MSLPPRPALAAGLTGVLMVGLCEATLSPGPVAATRLARQRDQHRQQARAKAARTAAVAAAAARSAGLVAPR